jgi:cytochrome c-type biogenesis protein CcmH/NrfG
MNQALIPLEPSLLSLVAVVSLVVIALSLLFLVFSAFSVLRYVKMRNSFSDLAQQVLDQGKLDELADVCRKRLTTHADDVHAHYFLGMALYRKGDLRPALGYLKRVPVLNPEWNVSSIVEAIESQVSTQDDRPELKIVTALPVAERSEPS